MKLTCKTLFLALVIVGLVSIGAGVASAQDVYKVNYFDTNIPSVSGIPVPDATVVAAEKAAVFPFNQ